MNAEQNTTAPPIVTLAAALAVGQLTSTNLAPTRRALLAMLPVWIPIHAQLHRLTVDQVHALPARQALDGLGATMERVGKMSEPELALAFAELGAGLVAIGARLEAATATGGAG